MPSIVPAPRTGGTGDTGRRSVKAIASRSIAIGLLGLLSGCALFGATSEQRLTQLHRGMTYPEAARVMGSPGHLVSQATPQSGDFATVEWNGPGAYFVKRTQLDFLDGKLLSYTIDNRGDF